MSEQIQLNDWDLEQLKKFGFVASGKYVVVSMEEYKKLIHKSHKSRVKEVN